MDLAGIHQLASFFKELSNMATISLTFAGVPLQGVYSGDLATKRYSSTIDGITRTVDIIQSVPNNKGRWRHVVRYTVLLAPDTTGKRTSFTNTVTIDAPSEAVSTVTSGVLEDFLGMLSGNWDEIAAGQQ